MQQHKKPKSLIVKAKVREKTADLNAENKVNKSKLFASSVLVALAGLTGALSSHRENPIKQALDSLYHLVLPHKYETSLAAKLAQDEQRSALAYYDQAKTVFRCFENDACAKIFKDRTSKDSVKNNEQLYQHIKPYTHAFLLSHKNDKQLAQDILYNIPHSTNRIVALMNTAYYLRSHILYDDVVESSQKDYVNTLEETMQNGAGDCDDSAVAEALLANLQGYETYLISYRAPEFGHLVNAVELIDSQEVYEAISILKQYSEGSLLNLPVLQINIDGLWRDFLLFDASGRQMLSKEMKGESYAKTDVLPTVITKSPIWRQIVKDQVKKSQVKIELTHVPSAASGVSEYKTVEPSIAGSLDKFVRIIRLQEFLTLKNNQ